MPKTVYVLCLIGSFLLFCCSCGENDATEPEIENPMIFTLDINDITPTDASGALLGAPDNSDWTFDEDWPIVIENLFEEYDSLDHSCDIPMNINVYPAYPNPGNGTFFISMQKPNEAKISLEFVNKYGSSLNELKDITGTNISIDANLFVPAQDSFVRVYYLLSTLDNCAFKGHGDIQVK